MAYNVRIMPVKVCVGFWELMLVRAANNMHRLPASLTLAVLQRRCDCDKAFATRWITARACST